MNHALRSKIHFFAVFLSFAISAQISNADMGISLGSASWNVGTGNAGIYSTWKSTTPSNGGAFTVTNTGENEGIVKIKAVNSANWGLGENPELNAFSLEWGQTTQQGVEPEWRKVGLDYAVMFNLSGNSEKKFDLRYKSPTRIDPMIATQTLHQISDLGNGSKTSLICQKFFSLHIMNSRKRE